MYTWFVEIFSTNSDKARLISILISSVVALCILLLTQWFTHKRERSKLLVEKIEEISKLVSKYDRDARSFYFSYNEGDDNDTVTNKPHHDAYEALDDIEMLLHLYFPKNVFCNKENTFERMLNYKNETLASDNNGISTLMVLDSVREKHQKDVKAMRDGCRKIMREFT